VLKEIKKSRKQTREEDEEKNTAKDYIFTDLLTCLVTK
jgi:hypothetical protein